MRAIKAIAVFSVLVLTLTCAAGIPVLQGFETVILSTLLHSGGFNAIYTVELINTNKNWRNRPIGQADRYTGS